ncbi:hypothetical protein IMZ11_37625 [Microtetraspora sp. AC03309]|uniref:hypothetical protein n=1 Tax=Microtetraspora sp. AC03309 TaxID=2779376 RepID=UPI001E34AD1E|nr:hypothetical protein [Microtetraspora sp. AC03309]MCC5581339.1 hypothetical protein [Microtetraspora sp. AC03309]
MRSRLLDLALAGGQATPTSLAAELPFTRQAITEHLAVPATFGIRVAPSTVWEIRKQEGVDPAPERGGERARTPV